MSTNFQEVHKASKNVQTKHEIGHLNQKACILYVGGVGSSNSSSSARQYKITKFNGSLDLVTLNCRYSSYIWNDWHVSSSMLVNKLLHLVYIEYSAANYKLTYLQWIFFHRCINVLQTLMIPTITVLDNVYGLVLYNYASTCIMLLSC